MTHTDDMAAHDAGAITPLQIEEALHNLTMVENRLQRWADDARSPGRIAAALSSEELDGALADLQQACRFLRDQETPS